MTEITEEYTTGSDEPRCITLFGIVHPTKDEQYQCDVGHMELFPEDLPGKRDYDILSDTLVKFAGKRVKITIVEV